MLPRAHPLQGDEEQGEAVAINADEVAELCKDADSVDRLCLVMAWP